MGLVVGWACQEIVNGILVLFAFHPVGMAVLIGLGTLPLLLIGHLDEVATTDITTAVLMVVAALSPHDAWEQPILRVVDTGVGVAVGFGAASIAQRLGALSPKVRLSSATSPTASGAGPRTLSPTT